MGEPDETAHLTPPEMPPLTALAAAAAGHHELYTEYLKAGFNAKESLDLVKTFIVATLPKCACGS